MRTTVEEAPVSTVRPFTWSEGLTSVRENCEEELELPLKITRAPTITIKNTTTQINDFILYLLSLIARFYHIFPRKTFSRMLLFMIVEGVSETTTFPLS